MSINVTVNGNPIKIHRGKMVSAEGSTDKRRRIRFHQVRQQSSNIASNVCDNVKKSQSKQTNKPPVSPQDDEIEDIVIPMSECAVLEHEEAQDSQRRVAENNLRAAHRGQRAQHRLQIERNEANLKKAIPRQTKQITREIENARAAMIARQAHNKKPFLKKKQTTPKTNAKKAEKQLSVAVINSENPLDDDKDEDEAERNGNFNQNEELTKEVMSDEESPPKINSFFVDLAQDDVSSPKTVFRRPQRVSVDVEVHPEILQPVEPETRISDRIRNRNMRPTVPMNEELHFNNLKEPQANKENEWQSSRNRNLSRATHQGVSIHPQKDNDHFPPKTITACPVCLQLTNPTLQLQPVPCPAHRCYCPSELQAQTAEPRKNVNEIPQKPKVSIVKPAYQPQYSAQDDSNTQFREVTYFDRHQRQARKIITDKVQVHAVDDSDLVYEEQCEGAEAQTNKFSKFADERAKMAGLRGREAMRRQKVLNDYKTLMQKMPLLQKQERIAQLNPAKDRFHFSDERKKEHEKQRQQNLEHAFERLVPTKITIPPRNNKKPVAKGQKKTLQVRVPENEEQIDGEINGKADLQQLLAKLKSQKQELLKECKSLPESSNILNLIDNLDFSCKGTKACDDKHVQTEKKKSADCQSSCPVKRLKQVLILQNTSTQTSPQAERKKALLTSSTGTTTTSTSTDPTPAEQHKTEEKCICTEEKSVCGILIKVIPQTKLTEAEESLPEVIIRPCTTSENIVHPDSPEKRQTNQTKSPQLKRVRSASPKKASPDKQQPKKPSLPPTKSTKSVQQKKSPEKMTKRSINSDEPYSYTSYFSPPLYNQGNNGNAPTRSTKGRQDSNVLPYINKLLEMSRKNVQIMPNEYDYMSDVPTPSSSIMNASANRPERRFRSAENLADSTHIGKLSSLLKRFNLTPRDLHSFISATSSSRPSQFNSTTSSSLQSGPLVTPNLSQVVASTPNQEDVNMTGHINKWTDICKERINNLSAMIEQVRKEKKEMLETSVGPKIDNKKLPEKETSVSNSESPSLEQKQLNAQLLQINVHSSDPENEDLPMLKEYIKSQPDIEEDIVERYFKLIECELTNRKTTKPLVEKPDQTFTAMLDIPKLPKFIPQPSTSRKPPVAGQALRYNEVCHELSAIPEADSSRLSKSPQTPRKNVAMQPVIMEVDSNSSSEHGENSEPIEEMLKNIGLDWAIPAVRKMATNLQNVSSTSSSFGATSIRNFASASSSPPCRTSTPVEKGNITNKTIKLVDEVEELSPVAKNSKNLSLPDSFHTLRSGFSTSGTNNNT